MTRTLATMLLIIFAGWMIQPVTAQGYQSGLIEVETDKQTVYTGESLTYTIRAYIASDITDDYAIIEPPFDGFRIDNITEPEATNVSLEGYAFRQITVQYRLIPLRAGEIGILPTRLGLPATDFTDETVIESQSFTVESRRLPDDAPVSFTNAIGQFEATATVDDTTIAAGGATTLSLEIRGSGNTEQIIAPNIVLPAGWQLFDNNPIYTQDTPQFSTKTFSWEVIPSGVGALEIPQLDFTYFNPQTEAYQTIRTNRINLTILASTPTPIPPTPELRPQADLDTAETGEQPLAPILPLKPLPDTAPAPLTPMLNFWLLWLIAPAIFILSLITRVLAPRRDTRRPARNNNNRIFSTLNNLDNLPPSEAYITIAQTILDFVSLKASRPIVEATFADAIESLNSADRDALNALYQDAQMGRYAPVTPEDVQHIRQRTINLLTQLNTRWK